MVAVFSRSIDLLLEADQDLTKNGCLHPHDVHKHGLKHIWHDHWQSVALLALVSAIKFAFCFWCELAVRGTTGYGLTTETARAVVADNQNDVVLSLGALVATVVTQLSASLWFVDPSAACVLAFYIFGYWLFTGREQIEMIVGRAAEPSFLEMVRELAETHDPSMVLDMVRAYHYGPRFLVELDVVLDESTQLRESHDIGVLLQHKIEALPSVERCFVHIDYQHRDHDDHDHTTPVVRKVHSSIACGGCLCGTSSEMSADSRSGDSLLQRFV